MDLVRRLQLLGYALIAAAAVLGLVALQHMRTLAAYGYVCGGAAPHCPACPASLAALGLGAGVLISARSLGRSAVRRRA